MKLPIFHNNAQGGARWALSFADLCLVLLGFLLLLQAHKSDPAALGAGLRAAFGSTAPTSFDTAAAPLFEPGEAILLPAEAARFQGIGRQAAARKGTVHVESMGADAGAARFDGWELAAARSASIARAVAAGGLDASRIDLSVDGTGPAAPRTGQHVRVTVSS